MVTWGAWAGFAVVCLAMVLAPGPNMIYLVSRSITQGRTAGIISLCGVMLGFAVYVLTTMWGLTLLFAAAPLAYAAVKWAGAAYLLWLAWNAIRPGAKSMLEPRALTQAKPISLFGMGFLTNLLNPKAAVLYLSLLPQFENPARGSLLLQGAILGVTQMTISFTVNLMIILAASTIARVLATRPTWLRVQRWFMASVLSGLALHLAFARR